MIADTFSEARAMLARITFGMPGWSIELRERDAWTTLLVLVARVENTYQPGQMVTIHHAYPLPLGLGTEAFVGFVRQCIHRALMHEADEWIRVDGEMVFNPHA